MIQSYTRLQNSISISKQIKNSVVVQKELQPSLPDAVQQEITTDTTAQTTTKLQK